MAHPPINGRYRVVRPLGQGGSGKVLLVEDLHHGRRLLALKAIRSAPDELGGRRRSSPGAPGPGDSALLRWEFSELADLTHPNLARVFEIDRVTAAGGDPAAGLERGTTFFTAEYVPGRHADEAADALSSSDLDGRARFAIELGIGVARALAFVHGKGILHRDVKPANLIVPADGPAAVRLVDFGLSRRRSVQDGLVAGSLPYLAPEALGAQGDVRSDLYALGVVLYRVASGRLPFEVPEGGDLRPMLRAVLAGDAPPLEQLCPGIDRGLARVVARLLEPDPGARHSSARSVAADLARASLPGRSAPEITGVVDAESETDTSQARVAWVRSVGLVGRRAEEEALLARVRAALRGTGPIVARVAGSFGSGRTRLVREAFRRLQIEAAAEGRPAARETSGSVADLASALSCPADPLACGERLLASSITGAHVVHLDPGDSPEALALTRHLERATPTSGAGLSVVAEVEAGAVGAIELGPFGPRDVESFIEAIVAGPAPRRLASALLDATGGVPLLVEEALLAMVRDRPIADLARTPVPKLVLPRSLELAMDARLAALPADLSETIAALAVMEAASPESVAEVLEVDSAECARRIATLLRLGLCEAVTGDGAVVVRRPIAAAALRRAGDEQCTRLHRAAFDAVGDPERRALHAVGAGLGAQAAEVALEAARAAEGRGDVPAAIRHMRAALARLPEQRRSEATVSLALLQARAGDYVAARETLAGAAEGDDAAALLDAEVARRMGDAPGAEKRVRGLLGTGRGRAVALEARSLAARLALDSGDVERARTLLGSDDHAAAPAARAAHAEVLGQLHLRAGDHHEAESAFDHAGELARAAGDARLEARACSLAGTALHLGGKAEAAARRYADAARIAREVGDVHGEATYTVNLGSALVDGGQYAEALPSYRRAIEMLGRLGAARQIAGALANYANLLFFLGDVEAAALANDRAMRAADSAGDAIVRGYVTMNLGDVHRRNGEVRAARERYHEAVAIFESVSSPRDASFAHLAAAELALAEDDLAAASAERELARAAAGKEARGELDVRLDLLDARIGLERNEVDHAAAAAARAGEHARGLGHKDLELRAAGVEARVAHAKGDRAGLGRAARTAAEVSRLLLDAVPDVYRQSFLIDPERRVASELAMASLPPAVRGSTESDASGRGDDALWRRLAAVTKRLTSELRLPILLEYILDTAIELLQADRGFLLIRGKDGTLSIRSARNFSRGGLRGDELQLSRSIAESVALGADPVIAVDALTDGRFESTASVQSFKLRSVLAVPLRVHGGILGALYLDDRYRPGVFGQTDVELAQELADQAAIAIENARLHAENRRRARRIEALNRRLERTVESQRTALDQMRGELDRSLEALETKYRYEDLVGRSSAMGEVLRLLDRVTDSDVSVVIQGESGTGKELVARAVHYNGPRRARPFVAVNCGAFTETLLESELFGHVRGAFTGADRTRTGLFEAASEGTLLLDEVAEMSVAMQAKLLRVLQESEVRPVGGNESRKVDVRVIAASNRDLGALVQAGKFREDLYYRLNVITLKLPALRDRREDIPELVAHFVGKHAGGRSVNVDKKAMARLYAFPWPGNVRQLENEVMRFLVLCDDTVREEHLSPEIAAGSPDEETVADDLDLKSQVERLERRLIRRALRESRGNQTKTARALGLSRFGLQKKLRRYGLG